MTSFPDVQLGQAWELSLNGTWTDATGFVRHGGSGPDTGPVSVSIGRGRADEMTGSPSAQTAAWEAVNTDGRFTARNPVGAYYPYLQKGTQTRWSYPSSSTYLRLHADNGGVASCPDAAGLHVTSDLDVRVDLKLTGWASGIIAARWVSGGSDNSWLLVLNADGTVTLFWSTTGSDFPQAQSAVPLVPQVRATQRFSLRATIDVNNGASGRTITFYTGPAGGADGSSWTQLGPAIVQSGTTSIHAGSTTGISAGNYTPPSGLAGVTCSLHELEVRSGIGGTVVAHPVFTSQAAGATSFTDAQSNTWTVSGTGELSGKDFRFHGVMSDLATTWDPTGEDVWAQLAAAGPLRRMGQGTALVRSPLRRGILSQSGTLFPVAYWPGEDAAGASSLGSAVGGPVMTRSSQVQMASDSASFAGSAPLPVMNGGSMAGVIPPYASSGSLIVRFPMNVSSAPANNAIIMRVAGSGTCRVLYLYYTTGGGLGFRGLAADGSTVFDSGPVSFGVNSVPTWVSMELRPGGGSTVNWSVETLQPGASSAPGFSGTFTGSIGVATALYPGHGNALGQVTLGHFQVQSDWVSLFSMSGPLDAWAGELAAVRFARLCAEAGLASRIVGPPSASAAMGAQAIDTPLNLLQTCETADQGQIFEPRQVYGLGYRTSFALAAQSQALVADYSLAQLSPPLAPVDNDQRQLNDITVQRQGGTTVTAALSDGTPMSTQEAGDYGTSVTAVLASDAQVGDAAWWRLNVGTVNDVRYPGITFNLASTDAGLQALAAAVRAVDVGDYVQVVNLPAFVTHDTIDQLAWGMTELIGDFTNTITFNAVPQKPWAVLVAGSGASTDCRAQAVGSTLAAGVSSGATALSVATAVGQPLWTTNPAHFPLDIGIAGERITVTLITGTSSPQAFTVTRSVNGVVKSLPAGAAVGLWSPVVYALTGA